LKLLNFEEFIFEARLSDHAGTRIEQRIKDTMILSFPKEARDAMVALGKTQSEVAVSAVALVKEEFEKRLSSRVLNFDFSQGQRIVVLLEPNIKIGAKRFPIKMTVSSFDEDRPDIVKTYSGEKLCCYVMNNVVATIKLLPNNYTDSEISADFESHLSRKGKLNGEIRISSTDSEYLLELTEDGQVKPFESQRLQLSSTIEKDFTLTPGRKIKYYSKLTDSLVEVSIVEVLNKGTYQADKLFKIKTKKADGSEAMKTLKAGDAIYIPLGEDGGFVQARVADQLYTIDKRVPNPILRVIA
jgi:hypothetical protein